MCGRDMLRRWAAWVVVNSASSGTTATVLPLATYVSNLTTVAKTRGSKVTLEVGSFSTRSSTGAVPSICTRARKASLATALSFAVGSYVVPRLEVEAGIIDLRFASVQHESVQPQ